LLRERELSFIFRHKNSAILSFFAVKEGPAQPFCGNAPSPEKGRTGPVDGHITAKKMQDQTVLNPPHIRALLTVGMDSV
jgi:hypothetical protein